MIRKINSILLFCGIILMLSAAPVIAQKQEEAEGRIGVNRVPLNQFFENFKQSAGRNIDLTKPFLVELKAELSKDGRLNAQKSKFTRTEGDAQLTDFAKKLMLAVGDSYSFNYLSKLGVEKLDFTLGQDNDNLSMVVKSEVLTVEKAKTIAAGLNSMVAVAKTKVTEDEKILVDSLRVTSQGKEFIINLELPKSEAHEMIQRKLQESPKKESDLSSKY